MQFTKKLVLMPQDAARVLNVATKNKTHSRLNQIDEEMKSTLDREDLSLYEKVELYNQILQRYLDTEKKAQAEPIHFKLSQTSEETDSKHTKVNASPLIGNENPSAMPEQFLKNFPKSIKSKANLLLERLNDHRQSKHETVIDWNTKGELLYDGKLIKGSNITDLFLDVLQTRKDFNPLGWQEFIHGLTKLNFPEAHVRNVKRRDVMHQIKKKGALTDDVKLLPTPPREVGTNAGGDKRPKRRKIEWENF